MAGRNAEKMNKRSIKRKFVSVLAGIVVFSTTYALILPAITLDQDTASDDPGIYIESLAQEDPAPEIEYSDLTYEAEPIEEPADEAEQWDILSNAVDAAIPDNPEEEEPAEPAEDTEISDKIVDIADTDEFVEAEDYDESEDILGEETELSGDPTADVESFADWDAMMSWLDLTGVWADDLITVAHSQLGYTESALNFVVGESGRTYGYTRYGDWYGMPYGDWCAMFVSFCLYYAGIPQSAVPYAALCPNWVSILASYEYTDGGSIYASADSGYIPSAGDLVFFDNDGDGWADHVGIVTGYYEETYIVDGYEVVAYLLSCIEGRDGAVCENTYDLAEGTVLGYGRLPENMAAQSFAESAGGVSVSVEADEGAFPIGTTMTVREVGEEDILDSVSDVVDGEIVRVHAVDITFYDRYGYEIEPAIPIRVTMSAAAVEEAAPVVVHVDGEGEAEIIAHDEAASEAEEIVFDAEAFSVYAIVYTVDFEYEDPETGESYFYSITGGEDILLSELLASLGIEADMTGSAVRFTDDTLLAFTALENADGETADWLITSLRPFSTKETLTITLADGNQIIIDVTDDQETGGTEYSNLKTLLSNATITINGVTYGDELWAIKKGDTYTIHLLFTEISGIAQFSTSGGLTYQLPSAFVVTENVTYDLELTDNLGNTYTGNTYTIGTDGTVTITLSDETKTAVGESGNTRFILDISGVFDSDAKEISFSDGVKRTVNVDDSHHVTVNKTGVYSADDDKMHYTVTVYSDGTSENVVVQDTISGTALTYDKNAVVSGASSTPNVIDNDDGFVIQIPSMKNGETVTITYTASVDHTKLSGTGVTGETDNTVTVKATDDQGDKDDLISTIDYQPLTKNSGAAYNDLNDSTKKILPWTITVNKQMIESMKGKTITDKIGEASQSVMSYTGNVTIKAYSSKDATEPVTTYTVTPEADAKSWSYMFEDDETYWYEITYETVVDASGKIGSTDVSNSITDGTHTVNSGGRVGPGEDVHLTKTAASVSTDSITWTVSFTVPKSGLGEAVITDTAPTTWGIYFDEIESMTVTNWGSVKVGDESYDVAIASDKRSGTVTFYKGSSSDSDTGLNASDSERTITIEVVTKCNQDWINAFPVGYDATSAAHTNNVNLNNLVFTSASATPVKQMITKKVTQFGTVKVNGVDVPIYRYELAIQGMPADTDLSITDSFDPRLRWLDIGDTSDSIVADANNSGIQLDTSWEQRLFAVENYNWLAETRTKRVGDYDYDGTTHQLVIAYTAGTMGTAATDESAATPDVNGTLTFTCSRGDIPKNGDGKPYDTYYIYYYLVPSDISSLMTESYSGSGAVKMNNTAAWGNETSSATVSYEYPGLKKDQIAYNDSTNKAQFEIVINPGRQTLNEGNPLTLTDTYVNLSVDYSTIQIVSVDENGNETALGSKYTYNYSGNTGTFTIPDETKVIIRYWARVIGEGSVTYENLAIVKGFSASTKSTKNISATSSGSMDINYIRLLKYKSGDMTTHLNGAVFMLVDKNGNPIVYPATATNGHAGEPITFTTGAEASKRFSTSVSDGYVHIFLDEKTDGMSFQKGVTYYLKEVTAPPVTGVGYQVSSIIYRFTIMDNPDYDNYEYYQDDIMKVADEPAKGVMEIDKKVLDTSDNALSLTEEQKKEITFTIVKVDPVTHEVLQDFTPITLTYDDFTNGKYRLENLEAGHYQVQETHFNIDGYTHEETDIEQYAYAVHVTETGTKYDKVDSAGNVDQTNEYTSSEDSNLQVHEKIVDEDKNHQEHVEIDEVDISVGTEHKVVYTNKYTPNGVSVVVKKTSDDAKPIMLYDAEFKLEKRSDDGETWTAVTTGALANTAGKGDKAGTFTIGYENRKSGVTLTGLEAGTYRLTETVAPEGYKKSDDPIVFTIAENGTISGTGSTLISFSNDPASVTVKNSPAQTYTLTKVEKGRLTAALTGAEFGLYKYASIPDDANTDVTYPDELLCYLTTDADGQIVLDWQDGYSGYTKDSDGNETPVTGVFDQNSIYYLKETTAPVGYYLPSDPPKYYFYNKNSSSLNANARFTNIVNATGAKGSVVNLASGPQASTAANERATTYISVRKEWRDWSDGWIDAPVSSINYKVYQVASTYDTSTEEYSTTTKAYPNDTTIYTLSGSGSSWLQSNVLTGLPTGASEDGKITYYSYIVKEVDASGNPIDDGRTVTLGSDSYAVGYDSDNAAKNEKRITNRPEPTEITVTKVWSDDTPASEIKEVGVKVYRDMAPGETVQNYYYDAGDGIYWVPVEQQQEQKLNSGNQWTTTFTNLTKGITYHIVESQYDAWRFTYTVTGGTDGTNVFTGGETAIVTNTYALVDIHVKKQWAGVESGDQSSVTLQLYRDKVEGEDVSGLGTYTYNGSTWYEVKQNGWQITGTTDNGEYTFKELPAGYTYHVVETGVTGKNFSDYTVVYDNVNEDGLSESGTTTIINALKDGSLVVYKVWDDGDAADRPENVSLKLIQKKATVTGKTVSVTVTDKWNNQYSYSDIITAGNSITLHIPESYWDYNGINRITYNGSDVGTWTYDSNNKLQDSTGINGGVFTFSDLQDENTIVITTEWNPSDLKLITFSDYALATIALDDGVVSTEAFTLTGSDNWTKTFTNLETDAVDGKQYLYFVEEDDVPSGYSVSYSGDGVYNDEQTGIQEGCIIVTNTKVNSDEARVSKSWVNADGTTEWPDGVTVEMQLMQSVNGGTATEVTTVPSYYRNIAENETASEAERAAAQAVIAAWNNGMIELTSGKTSYTWEHLDPKDDSDNTITYSVRETAVLKDSEDISDSYNTVITNSRGTARVTNYEKTSVAVTKEWLRGSSDAWPSDIEKVTVGLYQQVNGGEVVPVQNGENDYTRDITSETTDSKVTFENLPQIDENGNAITYIVKELSITDTSDNTTAVTDATVGDYAVTVSDVTNETGAGRRATVTNTYTGQSVTASKTWAPETDKTKAARVQLTLKNGTETVTSAQLTAWGSEVTENPVTITGNESTTWTNLPKSGTYTVAETVLDTQEGYVSYALGADGKYAAGKTSAVIDGVAGFVNLNNEEISFPINKTWADFAATGYSWTAKFRIQYREYPLGSQTVNAEWSYCTPDFDVEISKVVSEPKQTVTVQSNELPKYNIAEDGTVLVREYSAEEVYFVVNDSDGKLLYKYDAAATPQYTFGTGADESKKYTAFYSHDANEKNDGEWHLDISNTVGKTIKPVDISIDLTKTWESTTGSKTVPDGAGATFTLHRYVQEEYSDYHGLDEDAATITVVLKAGDTVINTIETKSGATVYVDGTFAANTVGEYVFTVDGKQYSLKQDTVSANKELVRSPGFVVTGSEGDVITVQLNTSDFSLLADGMQGIRVTDTYDRTARKLDTDFSKTVTFPDNDGDDWAAVFSDLESVTGTVSEDGNYITYTIYSYYLTETHTPANYTVSITDANGNIIDADNPTYVGGTVNATNKEEEAHYHIEKRWYRQDASQQPPVAVRVGIYKENINGDSTPVTKPAYSDSGVIVEYDTELQAYILSSENDWNMNLYGLTGVGGDYKVFVQELGVVIDGKIVELDKTYFQEKHYVVLDSNGLIAGKTPEWWESTNYIDFQGQIYADPQGDKSATGTTLIYNMPKDIGYQPEFFKHWYAFDGQNGMQTLGNDYTGGDPGAGFVVQLMQKATILSGSNAGKVVSDGQITEDETEYWHNYKKEFTVYRGKIVGATGQYESMSINEGWRINIQQYDLPKYGYAKVGDEYVLVQYDYEFKEVGVINGTDGYVWTKAELERGAISNNRINVDNYEAGQLEIIKSWELDTLLTADEVYFKIYSDWWFSGYHATATDGLYDVTDIIGNDVYKSTNTRDQQLETQAYWLPDGAQIRNIEGLGYVLVLTGTSNEWSGLVSGLPLLQTDRQDGQGQGTYGEVLYTIEEVGASYRGSIVKVGDSSWPYTAPVYVRNTRDQGENAVEKRTTFQIDSARMTYSSYFKATNSDEGATTFRVSKTWAGGAYPSGSSPIAVELQALRIDSGITSVLTGDNALTEEQQTKLTAGTLTADDLTDDQIQALTAGDSGWYTAEISTPVVTLPKNYDYTSLTGEAYTSAAAAAWTYEWNGLPSVWKNASGTEVYHLVYRVVETSHPDWVDPTITAGKPTVTDEIYVAYSASIENNAADIDELTVTKNWTKDEENISWPAGYEITYKLVRQSVLAKVENRYVNYQPEEWSQTAKTIAVPTYTGYGTVVLDETEVDMGSGDNEKGTLTSAVTSQTFTNLPMGALWTVPENAEEQSEATKAAIEAGVIEAGKTYAVGYRYVAVETSVKMGDKTLTGEGISAVAEVTLGTPNTANAALTNELTDVTVRKDWNGLTPGTEESATVKLYRFEKDAEVVPETKFKYTVTVTGESEALTSDGSVTVIIYDGDDKQIDSCTLNKSAWSHEFELDVRGSYHAKFEGDGSILNTDVTPGTVSGITEETTTSVTATVKPVVVNTGSVKLVVTGSPSNLWVNGLAQYNTVDGEPVSSEQSWGHYFGNTPGIAGSLTGLESGKIYGFYIGAKPSMITGAEKITKNSNTFIYFTATDSLTTITLYFAGADDPDPVQVQSSDGGVLESSRDFSIGDDVNIVIKTYTWKTSLGYYEGSDTTLKTLSEYEYDGSYNVFTFSYTITSVPLIFRTQQDYYNQGADGIVSITIESPVSASRIRTMSKSLLAASAATTEWVNEKSTLPSGADPTKDEVVGTVSFPDTDKWSKTWENLPKYSADGKEYVYYAYEESYTGASGATTLTTSYSVENGTLVVTNTPTYSDKGNLKVEKKVFYGGALNTDASELTFTVGLFTKDAEENLTKVKYQTISVTEGKGETTFAGLEPGTYYIYEIATDGTVITETGNKATIDGAAYTVTYEDNTSTVTAGTTTTAKITNTRDMFKLNLLKVDKNDESKTLSGAEFTLHQLYVDNEETGHISYVENSERTVTTGSDGKAAFDDLALGYYEIKETRTPDGYILTGSSTFCIKVTGTGVQMVIRDDEAPPEEWEATATSGLATFTAESGVYTATVRNEAGAALPSTGGGGTVRLRAAGIVLAALAGGVLMLRGHRRRKRA